MPAKYIDNLKGFSLDGKNTVFIYGAISKSKPGTIYVRLSPSYGKYSSGTKWLQFSKNSEGYEAEGVRSTADVKSHCKIVLEKNFKVVLSTLPLGFTSAWVR